MIAGAAHTLGVPVDENDFAAVGDQGSGQQIAGKTRAYYDSLHDQRPSADPSQPTMPPLTEMICPVTYDESSPASQATALAISSASPKRFSGMFAM